MQDAWRAYLELALGLTEASKKKAQQVARKLVGQSGTTAAQLQALAEDLIATSAANRESLTKLVRFEVDRALGVVGLATVEEVADLTARVRDLERDLREAQAQLFAAGAPATSTVVAPDAGGSVGDAALAAALGDVAGVAPGPAAEQAAPAKGAIRKAVAKKAVAEKAVARQTPAKKAVARQTPAKKAVAKKAVAKKAAGS